jgi:hypothetical protein
MIRLSASSTLKLAPAFAAVLALSACTTTQMATRDSPAKGSAMSAAHPVDAERVARVEAAARRQGVRVYWVNPPRRRD